MWFSLGPQLHSELVIFENIKKFVYLNGISLSNRDNYSELVNMALLIVNNKKCTAKGEIVRANVRLYLFSHTCYERAMLLLCPLVAAARDLIFRFSNFAPIISKVSLALERGRVETRVCLFNKESCSNLSFRHFERSDFVSVLLRTTVT